MRFSHLFIDRPILAAVISIFILILGGISYFSLPVTQYPDVAPPTIVVVVRYPGASAQVVADTVAAPIELEVNGVEGMLYMSSQSTSDGLMRLTITFELGTDLDKAQVLVQNRVSIAEPRLPEEARKFGIITRKESPDLLLVIHLLSPDGTYDQLYLANFAQIQVRDTLSRIDGVGNVQIFGARDYSMRIWLDPDRIASLGLTAGDIVEALREQNVQVTGGTLGQRPLDTERAFQFGIQLQGRLTDVEEFENIIVKASADGRFTRLRDVARVELGASEYGTNVFVDGQTAVDLAVTQRPGSNALATAKIIRDTMEDLSKDFPKGLEYRMIYNPTEFIEKSIQELSSAIFQAIFLVVLVILLFLQTWRAAIIPLVTIPISLIGTFSVMAVFGFSINNLTLFGLVLAVGIVVDDAIVVVESVERNIAKGMSARDAARRTMDEVGVALIAIALVLSSVFIPVAFVSGISGEFYRQFSLTIAVATIISAFNALTLSPALCALLLSKRDPKSASANNLFNSVLKRFFGYFNLAFDWLRERYALTLHHIMRRNVAMVSIYIALIFLTIWGFMRVPTGFIPAQDQGYFVALVRLPDGASFNRTEEVMHQAERIILDTPGLSHAVSFVGLSVETMTIASNAGTIFAVTEPVEERQRKGLNGDVVLADLRARLSQIQEGVIAIFPPPPVRGMGNLGGFSLQIQDRRGRGIEVLQQAVDRLVVAANSEPSLTSVYTPFSSNTPQLFIDVDRVKARMLDVPIENVFETLEVYLGSSYVNDFNFLGRAYRVIAQADAPFRMDVDDIRRLRTLSDKDAVVPLGSIVNIREIAGPERIARYNLYQSAQINGDTVPGFSTGQAIRKMEELAQRDLPDGISFEWTGLAYQQILAGNTAIFIFPLSVLFVFLTLAALYESWSLPLAIILIVPMCLSSSIAGVALRGLDNNILTQIGFIVLVGLASKNAILIVEFARAIERQGKTRFEAAVEASRLRLRPILMTSLAFIFGILPLLFASGEGAEMRQALGTAVFGGMLGVTIFGLLFTPVFYVMIRAVAMRSEKRK